MARLIDADALIKQWENTERFFGGALHPKIEDVIDSIKNAPTIEAEPTLEQIEEYCRKRCLVVVDSALFNEMKSRWSAEPIKHGTITLTYEEYGELCSYALADEQKHGKWLIDKSGSLMCSKCGTLLDEEQKPSRFCPNCGAKMDEVEE